MTGALEVRGPASALGLAVNEEAALPVAVEDASGHRTVTSVPFLIWDACAATGGVLPCGGAPCTALSSTVRECHCPGGYRAPRCEGEAPVLDSQAPPEGRAGGVLRAAVLGGMAVLGVVGAVTVAVRVGRRRPATPSR